jgi:geranylgeranyl reductase family protein
LIFAAPLDNCLIARDIKMNSVAFDVIICGAGPAGSTAAIRLRNSGLNVALIDAAEFPRDKVCGDAVSSVNKNILRQIDPLLEQDLLNFAPKSNITQAILHSPDFQKLQVGFKKVGHCIRRRDFDHWLFKHAISSVNVTVVTGKKIKSVASNNQGVEVLLADGTALQGKIILGCDGAHSVVSKQLAGFKVDRNHYSGAVRQYYKNIDGLTGNALEVYFLKGFLPGYFWIFPLSSSEANVGFGMLSQTIADKKIDLKQSLKKIVQEIPEVAQRFKNATALEQPIGFGLPLGSKKYTISGTRFMLCGDAASLIDPFSGEGIETAMESGKFAAEQVLKCFEKNDFSSVFIKSYDDRVYKKMWPNFRNHYYLQRLLSDRVGLINTLVRIGNIPFVNRQITRLFY